jgi:hypothetical protein
MAPSCGPAAGRLVRSAMLLRKGVLGGDVAQLSGQTLAFTKGFSKGVLDKVLTCRTISLGTHRVLEGAFSATRASTGSVVLQHFGANVPEQRFNGGRAQLCFLRYCKSPVKLGLGARPSPQVPTRVVGTPEYFSSQGGSTPSTRDDNRGDSMGHWHTTV